MGAFIVNNVTLISYLIAAAVGLSVALVAWLLTRSASELPQEDREYKDPPPIGFRLVWWPVQWLSHHAAPLLLSRRSHASLSVRLRKAGLDYSLTPAQFMATRMVGAIIMATAAWWLLGSFDPSRRGGTEFKLSLYFQVAAFGALFGWAYPAIWLRDRLALRRSEVLKSLPFFLDIITLCVEAGLNMQGAITQAVAKGPKGVLREELQRVMRDIRAGKSRAMALRDMAERLNEPSIMNFTTAVIQAESMGMNLGPVLRAQADQRRSERFLRAEKLAMEAPVKMLFPLIAFIFPCTFLVLFFPIVMKFMNSGL
ncbi:MAG: type II secretion system F family protein [Herminiimonas sp.]|nr:type II secretion system F family protein [Herminiimonas sp.]